MESKIPSDYIKTGRLGRTYKTEGYLYFWTQNSKANLLKAAKVLASDPKTGKILNLSIEDVLDSAAGGVLIKFENYDSLELAKRLSNYDIYVLRDFAATLKQGEVYVQDLIGLQLVVQKDAELLPVAKVVDVREGAQSELLFCKMLEAPFKTFYVPYMKVFVGEADLAKGTIELLLPSLLP